MIFLSDAKHFHHRLSFSFAQTAFTIIDSLGDQDGAHHFRGDGRGIECFSFGDAVFVHVDVDSELRAHDAGPVHFEIPAHLVLEHGQGILDFLDDRRLAWILAHDANLFELFHLVSKLLSAISADEIVAMATMSFDVGVETVHGLRFRQLTSLGPSVTQISDTLPGKSFSFSAHICTSHLSLGLQQARMRFLIRARRYPRDIRPGRLNESRRRNGRQPTNRPRRSCWSSWHDEWPSLTDTSEPVVWLLPQTTPCLERSALRIMLAMASSQP